MNEWEENKWIGGWMDGRMGKWEVGIKGWICRLIGSQTRQMGMDRWPELWMNEQFNG